jgi:hypothetical protein
VKAGIGALRTSGTTWEVRSGQRPRESGGTLLAGK